MGEIPKWTFLQRHPDGQQAHGKMLDIASYQRNANRNCNEVPTPIGQNGHQKNSINNRF